MWEESPKSNTETLISPREAGLLLFTNVVGMGSSGDFYLLLPTIITPCRGWDGVGFCQSQSLCLKTMRSGTAEMIPCEFESPLASL